MTRANWALYSDGNDYVYFTNVTSLGANAFSISFWAKTSTTSDSDFAVWQPLSLPEDLLVIRVIGSSGHLFTVTRDHGGGGTTNVESTASVNTGSWVFITYTRSPTNGIKQYINGVLDGSAAAAANNNGDIIATDFKIMRDNYSTGRPLTGSMTRFCIWNKELSLAEVQDIMNRNDYTERSADIRHYWAMDEGTGTITNTLGTATISYAGTSPAWVDGAPLSGSGSVL